MLMKTLLNRVHPVKGFVYDGDRLIRDTAEVNGARIEVGVRPRRGSRGVCSGCGRRGRTYDTQPARRFGFVPLWGLGGGVGVRPASDRLSTLRGEGGVAAVV
jgi:transposase